MGWLKCTRAGAGLQQIRAGKTLPYAHPAGMAQQRAWRSALLLSDVTSEDRKIAQLSGNLPLAAYDGAKLRRSSSPQL